jgi:hypothetical protein
LRLLHFKSLCPKTLDRFVLSYQFVLLPFVAVSASAWLADEKLNPVLLGGAILVLFGVFVGVLYKPRHTHAAASPSQPVNEMSDEDCSTCQSPEQGIFFK